MTLSKEQEKKLLVGLIAVLGISILYRTFVEEPQKTAPLTYARGAVATSPVRSGLARPSQSTSGADPLGVLLARREEKYPGVLRNIFSMENPVVRPAQKSEPAPETQPTEVAPPLSTVPEKTPEQIAEEAAREDLSKFRFLGYLSEKKDNTLFLSKDGELFMVKIGEKVVKSYRIKEASKDHVILTDTITRVEVRVELSGSDQAATAPGAPPPPHPPRGR